jgi:peptidoglycan/xylan/chitin deacetylase (PgdA/CDA1 family)
VKHRVYRVALSALALTGAARLAAPRTRGLGAILMAHHVRPTAARSFDPNRILEITPQFLDQVLTHVKRRGYDVIPLDAVAERLAAADRARPFVVLTFDDGYRDNLTHALPVLRAHGAPFTLYVTTGFADGMQPLWWRDVEQALAVLPEVEIDGSRVALHSDGARRKAFAALMRGLRGMPAPLARAKVAELAKAAAFDPAARTRAECLNWEELRALADEPLCTFGAHTLSHPLLAREERAQAQLEMAGSRALLEARLGRTIKHFAYPVGDPVAAGRREFALAQQVGFATAVTTRPGVLFAEHAEHLHALPRLSLNGLYQSVADFDVLLSGAAFALANRGRRVNVS